MFGMNVKHAYIIAGPTASGKSSLAHELAKRINGTIINCDSVQIYSGIENISASPFAGRPLTGEIQGVPYKLFSILSLKEQISVADYIQMAKREYNKALNEGRVPIFVGGTGYYINCLINGIADVPEISPEIRKKARDMVARDVHAAKKLVPQCPAVDPQRIARAVEVVLQTGRELNDWWANARVGAISPTPFKVLLNPPVDVLRLRIAARVQKMLAGGAYQEIEYIMKNRLNPRRAIGADQLYLFMRGDITQKVAISSWEIKTNQYAKRQRTWFSTQFDPDLVINHLPTMSDVDLILK